MRNIEQIWVSKKFKHLLKLKALENDSSILKLTEQLANDEEFKSLKRKKNEYRF